MTDERIKKIVFVTYSHDTALRRWAVWYLSAALKGLGVKVSEIDLAYRGSEKDCEDADVVVVYRCFNLRSLRLMKKVRMLGPFVVFFLDDYLFQPNCKYTGDWEFTLEPLAEADALMSSSRFLLDKMPFDKPKILRRSVLDRAGMETLRQQYRRNPDMFSVGWTAGAGRGNMLDGFLNETLRIVDDGLAEGERVRFYCFGMHDLDKRNRVEIKQNVMFSCSDWKGLYTKFKAMDLGVVINPMDEKDEFWSAKSELKFVESAAMGVPLITSRLPPYVEFIKEGVNGFLASTPKEFAERILQLKREELLSRIVSENAFTYVRENYDVMRNAEKFLKDLAVAKRKVMERRVS